VGWICNPFPLRIWKKPQHYKREEKQPHKKEKGSQEKGDRERQPQVLSKIESSRNNLEQEEDALILEFFFSSSLLSYLNVSN